MAKFQPRLNIWELDDGARAKLQPGQHVTAGTGTDSPRGVWLGMRGATQVVAWAGNAARHPKGPAAYRRALRDYATA